MRFITKIIVCLCFFNVGALAQERITKTVVGPNNDEIRLVAAFIEPSEEFFKMRSMIVDFNPIKSNNQQPSYFQIDLTSTLRTISTGEKKQKILIIRWKKTGEIELKCDGKWKKQNTNSSIDKIIETTKTVIQNLPVDVKTTTDIVFPKQVETKVLLVLDSLESESFPCLRTID